MKTPEKSSATQTDLQERGLSEHKSWDDFDEELSIEWIDRAREQGIEEGLKTGLEQGIYTSQRATVRRMHANGFGLDEICLVTDLTRDKVEDFLLWKAFDKRFTLDLMDSDWKTGVEQGRRKGIEETTEKAVLRMLANGFDLNEICLVTDLSRDEAKRLRNRLFDRYLNRHSD